MLNRSKRAFGLRRGCEHWHAKAAAVGRMARCNSRAGLLRGLPRNLRPACSMQHLIVYMLNQLAVVRDDIPP